jgi:hypothetical protein
MPTKEQQYLEKAARCEARANEQVHEDLREGWLRSAREWRGMARRGQPLAENGSGRGPPALKDDGAA